MPKIDFDKLPKAEQRVVIAKDLIARLDAKRFKASGGYFQATTRIPLKAVANDEAQVKEVFAAKVCRGCELGGMFAAALDRCNALKLEDLSPDSRVRQGHVDEYDIRDYLGRWFSNRTLHELEYAFEGWESHYTEIDYEQFYRAVPNAEKRMRLITQNIIDNNGTFKPKQLFNVPVTA